jgi:hypothetical protein
MKKSQSAGTRRIRYDTIRSLIRYDNEYDTIRIEYKYEYEYEYILDTDTDFDSDTDIPSEKAPSGYKYE